MKGIQLLIAISIIGIFALSCNSKKKEETAGTKSGDSAFDMQKARTFIDSINIKWMQELKDGDSTAIAAHYGPDAKLLLSNREPLSGSNILSMWGAAVRSGLNDWKFVTTDLEGNSDYLIETGTYEIHDVNKKLADKGNYVVTWKKQPNGEWKLYRDVGVTSMPPAPGQ